MFCAAWTVQSDIQFDIDEPLIYTLKLDPSLRRADHGQVAQLVEHLTENQGVGGSNPSLATIINCNAADF